MIDTQVRYSSWMSISAGAVASNTTISSGGVGIAETGGLQIGTTVLFGGIEHVLGGGTANNTVISSGGVESVYTGATANGITISDGGLLLTGGTDSGVTVSSGGRIIISGATVGDLTLLTGATRLHANRFVGRGGERGDRNQRLHADSAPRWQHDLHHDLLNGTTQYVSSRAAQQARACSGDNNPQVRLQRWCGYGHSVLPDI